MIYHGQIEIVVISPIGNTSKFTLSLYDYIFNINIIIIIALPLRLGDLNVSKILITIIAEFLSYITQYLFKKYICMFYKYAFFNITIH